MTLLSMPEKPFEQWVKQLVDRHFDGRFQLLANRVGLTFSAFKRSVRGGSTSVETLLRICLATGESPETVFTVADKRVVHDLVTQLYGAQALPSMSQRARQVALSFDALDEPTKAFFEDSLEGLKAVAQQRVRNGGTLIAKTKAASGTAKKRGNQSR